MTPLEIGSYALEESLTLSVVIKGIIVETGEYVETDDNNWQEIPYGTKYLSGLQSVVGLDIWPVFRAKSVIIQRFKPQRPHQFIRICDQPGLDISLEDLLLTRNECVRFAQTHGLPDPAARIPKSRGGPGPSPRYDWDGFWIRICRRIHEDGVPDTQATLVRELLNWFAENYETGPDASSVKKKISRLWREIQV